MGDGMPLRRGIVSPQIHICSDRFLFLFLHPDEGDYPCAGARARYSFRRRKCIREMQFLNPAVGPIVSGSHTGRLMVESRRL